MKLSKQEVKIWAKIILVFLSVFAVAQNKYTVDSLNKLLLRSNDDTVMVNLLNQMAWEYRNADLHLTDSFAEEAIRVGKKAEYHKGIGVAYINKAFVQRNAGSYPA